MRRRFLTQMAALSVGAVTQSAFSQAAGGSAANYPSQPVKVLVPFPPGGSVDPIIRACTGKFHEMMGQPFVLDNRPGGTTSIACNALLQAPPDGHTLLFTAANTHVIHTIDRPHITYDPIKDFIPVAAFSRTGYVLVVHTSLPVNTVAEFAAYCKANPGKVSYASSGVGNANHLAFERLNLALGIKTTHVPYKAAATSFLDLVSGRVQACFSTVGVLQPGIDTGKLRALAYTAARPGAVPENLTIAKVGLPAEFDDIDSLNVLVAAKGTPRPIIDKLEATTRKILELPDIRTAFANQKQYAYFMSGQQLGARLTADITRYRKIVKDLDIKMEG